MILRKEVEIWMHWGLGKEKKKKNNNNNKNRKTEKNN